MTIGVVEAFSCLFDPKALTEPTGISSDPTPPTVMSSEELLVLTLAPNNPSNTIITSATGDVVYTVVTEHTKTTTTTQIRNAHEEVVASSEWRDVLPDKITIGNSKPISLGDWMKRSLVPFKE